ncbi:MAG TPA: S-methyl-5-thioribose-1-phosphate isomerase [Syntrophomonas sp.]|nr:S-methyl-5-thioribose-1-phosphate isomerase [Syntrophomonas sp.]HRW11749.1 S-methyl-5-thioribose-1-phosphate isomerase [Syntrophomonas sp.]
MTTIFWDQDAVVILDQNELPAQIKYVRCEDYRALVQAIKTLQVRGAPLIGVTAAYGLALAVWKTQAGQAALDTLYDRAEQEFAASRPTAVNLFWAIRRMRNVFKQCQGLNQSKTARILLDEADRILAEDVSINQRIGENGAALFTEKVRVMTICNAGALATGGYGTALGVIRSLHQNDNLQQVWACETRPVLQGARLTVWELSQDQIPVTLITDNMAAYVMSRGEVDAVIVGADRIAVNGDTANKIGTYGLAVLAAYHKIPFYVAAPMSTVDLGMSSGQGIPIEQRNHDEVRQIRGIYVTVPEVSVFNPAFDVTPGQLVTALITETGIIRSPYFRSDR